MRVLYLMLGLISVGLGYVGAIVPGMPSTVFFLIALWAFKRSSARLERWILYRSPFGPAIRDWERDRSMTRRNKIAALTMLWVGIGSSVAVMIYRHRSPWITGLVFACGVGVTIFLRTVRITPERPEEGLSPSSGPEDHA